MVAISWKLTIFSVVYLPLVALLIGQIVKRLRHPALRAQQNFGDLTSILDESLSGVKVIKSYNAEDYFRDKFHKVNDTFSTITRRMMYRQQLASPASEFLGIAAASGLMIFGGTLVLGGDSLSGSAFIAYLAIFSQITRPMRSFTDAFANINQGIAAGTRVLALLDTSTTIKSDSGAIAPQTFNSSIEFRNVHFRYEDREIIDGVSFKIERGQTVALVGPSGGGKSTISDLIPRFYDVCSGEILIDGKDLRSYDLHAMRELLGIVSQETVLFNDTIENNIRLGNSKATMEEVCKAARVATPKIDSTPMTPT